MKVSFKDSDTMGTTELNKNPDDMKCSLKQFNISTLSDIDTPFLTKDKGKPVGLVDEDNDLIVFQNFFGLFRFSLVSDQ